MPHVVHTQCKEYKFKLRIRVYLGHNENVTPLLTDFIMAIDDAGGFDRLTEKGGIKPSCFTELKRTEWFGSLVWETRVSRLLLLPITQ